MDGPLADIEELRQALTDPKVGLFTPRDVDALPDYGVQQLRERLDEFFSSAVREDVLLLYYSGHGELDLRGTLHLCAHDTKSGSLSSTALRATEITNMIDGSAAATIIMVLDCCHSGAFKGGDLAIPIAGKGRYVLSSNRSTQLARAAAQPGQPSPFTGLLVHGLRHAATQGHLTVTELYKHVHGRMTTHATQAPQLRIVGEGEVIIARRGNLPLPSPPLLTEPLIEVAPKPGMPGSWQAQRVRTGGARCILRVGNSTAEHTIEYRPYTDHTATVFLDGKRIYRGAQYLDCEFRLGRRGSRARLKVTDDPDIELWVDRGQVYTLRHSTPDSDSFLEHRALTIRNALLSAKENFSDLHSLYPKLHIAPDVPGRVTRAVLGTARRGASTDPIIGSLTTVQSAEVHTGFTDRALHICNEHRSVVVVPYDELLARAVTANEIMLQIGGKQIDLPGSAKETAQIINMVKGFRVYQETGLGETPLVHPLSPSLTRASRRPPPPRALRALRDQRFAKLSLGWGIAGVAAVQIAAGMTAGSLSGLQGKDPLRLFLVQSALFVPIVLLFLGLMVMVVFIVTFIGLIFMDHVPTHAADPVPPNRQDQILRPAKPKDFLWSLALIAAYATTSCAWITWAPDLGPPPFGEYVRPPQYGWIMRLGDSLTIAIGNNAEVAALGTGARVLGSLLIATALFLPIAVVLSIIRWTYLRRPENVIPRR